MRDLVDHRLLERDLPVAALDLGVVASDLGVLAIDLRLLLGQRAYQRMNHLVQLLHVQPVQLRRVDHGR